MTGLSFWDLAGLSLATACASLVILWIAGRVFLGDARHSNDAITTGSGTAFLFHGQDIADSDSSAVAGLDTWADMRKWLQFRFDGLPKELHEIPDGEATIYKSNDPETPATLDITPLMNATRVSLADTAKTDPAIRHEALRCAANYAHQTTAYRDAPYAICKTDDTGRILWQNAACIAIHDGTDDDIIGLLGALPKPGETQTKRFSIVPKDGSDRLWYEAQTTEADGFYMHYAIEITRVVQAENAQRQFVQTLTKTFANLTIGLAMFDRKQQLVLFNPALIDLTSLSAEFLSARPNLMSFFDNLRDRQVMPEPKNYADWREQINQVIEAASDGLYAETWTLPTGVTYRVTGRPHPDGAVAFLFEDITDEITLTRRFRAQLNIRQSVLDALDEAVIVIAPNNAVMLCNKATTALLGIDPDTSFADMGIRDLLSACEKTFPDTEFWQGLGTQISNKSLDPTPSGTVTSLSGEKMVCQVQAIAGGATLLSIKARSTQIPADAALLPM